MRVDFNPRSFVDACQDWWHQILEQATKDEREQDLLRVLIWLKFDTLRWKNGGEIEGANLLALTKHGVLRYYLYIREI